MADQDWLAQRFEQHRSRLEAVAYRMLGSRSDADDAVQEAWLRLSRTDPGTLDNLGGWLTTVVGRVCLDMLRSQAAHREAPLDDDVPQAPASLCDEGDPEEEALMAESVGLALLVVLDTLAPAERLAFVLHDMFGVPFAEIASVLGRSPNATKQLASRARQRVRAADATPSADATRQTELLEVVKAFLAASRDGDFAALLEVLDPDVVLRADARAIEAGALAEVRGALAVANQVAERAVETLPSLVVRTPGTVWAITARAPRAAFGFKIRDGKVVHINLVFDPLLLRELELGLTWERGTAQHERLHAGIPSRVSSDAADWTPPLSLSAVRVRSIRWKLPSTRSWRPWPSGAASVAEDADRAGIAIAALTPTVDTSTPPTAGPSKFPSCPTAESMPLPAASSSSGTSSGTRASEAGWNSPPPMPCTTAMASSTARTGFPASVCTPRAHIAPHRMKSAPSITGRGPKRSVSTPPTGMPPARETPEPARTVPSRTEPPPLERISHGRATA